MATWRGGVVRIGEEKRRGVEPFQGSWTNYNLENAGNRGPVLYFSCDFCGADHLEEVMIVQGYSPNAPEDIKIPMFSGDMCRACQLKCGLLW